MNSPIKVRIPKGSPGWAVGLVSILIAFGTVAIALYTTFRSEIQEKIKIQASEVQGKLENQKQDIETQRQISEKVQAAYKDVISTTLEIARNNNTQISNLSIALKAQQDESQNLKEEFRSLKLELKDAQSGLSDCEEKLSKCKGNK